MTKTTMNLVVVSGGLSEESTTHRLAEGLTRAVGRWVELEGVHELIVHRIDVRDHAQELAAASLTGFATGALAEAYTHLAQADAVIAVSPTYKASYTGLFKMFWDLTADGALAGVPVIVAATGGTPRHSLVLESALRPLFAYLKALVVPTGVFAATDDWAGTGLTGRMDAAAGELVAQIDRPVGGRTLQDEATNSASASTNSTGTIRNTRARANDPFVDVPTMAQLLG